MIALSPENGTDRFLCSIGRASHELDLKYRPKENAPRQMPGVAARRQCRRRWGKHTVRAAVPKASRGRVGGTEGVEWQLGMQAYVLHAPPQRPFKECESKVHVCLLETKRIDGFKFKGYLKPSQ